MDQVASSSSSSPELFQVRPPIDLGTLPDITDRLTPYHLRTLETIHRIYGTSSLTKAFCLSLSYHRQNLDSCLSHTVPIFDIGTYNMKQFTNSHLVPSPTPFAPDHNAAVLPPSCATVKVGAMVDIVEAIRHTTHIIVTLGEFAFHPPTTPEIQTWLSTQWPERYPSTHGTAQGWRNTVNQCLTHGQGWNFLTFPPTDGSKNKRHLLFERAFNESVIIGSGQCKTFNDKKPNKRRGQSPVRRTVMTTRSGPNTMTVPDNRFKTPPLPSPTESNSSLTSLPTESSLSSFSDSWMQSSSGYTVTASPSSFSDSSMQSSTGYALASPVNFTPEPLPTPMNDYFAPTALPKDSGPASWWDTSTGLSTETYFPNYYDTVLESTTINPGLLTMDADPVEKCERPLAEVEAELWTMLGCS